MIGIGMALDPEPFKFSEAAQRAMRISDLKQGYIAAQCGTDPSQFSQELRKFSDLFDRLINHVDEPHFWTLLVAEIARKAGVSIAVDVDRTARIALTKCAAACVDAMVALGHHGKQRMANASPRFLDERKRA